VVTTIGMLVHVYSIGTWPTTPGGGASFAYLNLVHVLDAGPGPGDNFLLVFAGWSWSACAATC